MNTREKLTQILTECLGVDAAKVTPEAMLIDDLGADSLDVVEIAMTIEDDFKIEIPDDDATKFSNGTVGAIVEYIDAKLAIA